LAETWPARQTGILMDELVPSWSRSVLDSKTSGRDQSENLSGTRAGTL